MVQESGQAHGSPLAPLLKRYGLATSVTAMQLPNRSMTRIGGMIAGSILDNNGFAITFGLITAIAALALVLVTQVSPSGSLAKPGEPTAPVVDERLAADLESRIETLDGFLMIQSVSQC